MKLLLTGFEPFGESPVNPSEQVVRMLAGREIEGVELHTTILPVDQERGPAALLAALDEVRPGAVLCLGEARSRAALSVERVAINLLDYRIADNAGNRIVDQPIVQDGPAAYFTTLPVRTICEAIQQAGIPAELSLSAGAFLCNQVTYVLLHHLVSQQIHIPAGFIHLPALPEQAARHSQAIPSMSLETASAGIDAAIRAIARS